MSDGPIAASYEELQGLRFLHQARLRHPLPAASPDSMSRAVYQCADVLLFNLADLNRRAEHHVRADEFGPAVVKLAWARGFHRVLVRLSVLPLHFGPPGRRGAPLLLSDSPAFAEFVSSLRLFEASMQTVIGDGRIDLKALLRDNFLDDACMRLVHLATTCAQQSITWETHLNNSPLWSDATYGEIVAPDLVRQAVYCSVLRVDSFLVQFRAMHQVQELLAAEVNDRLEFAIRSLRAGDAERAADYTDEVNLILESMLECLSPLTDSLAMSDYHRIRRYLGVTSGSHSVNLHYHLFTDLYTQFSEEVSEWLRRPAPESSSRRLRNAARSLRGLLLLWRDLHAYLPHNNLGSNQTRSLIGSADAVAAVQTMREHALAADRLELAGEDGIADRAGAVGSYVRSAESLGALVLSAAGEVTRERFPDVQERTGAFADTCPFTRPLERKV